MLWICGESCGNAVGMVFPRKHLFLLLLGNRETTDLQRFSSFWEYQLNMGLSSSTLVVDSSPRLNPTFTALILANLPSGHNLPFSFHYCLPSCTFKIYFWKEYPEDFSSSLQIQKCNTGWFIQDLLYLWSEDLSQYLVLFIVRSGNLRPFLFKCLSNKV